MSRILWDIADELQRMADELVFIQSATSLAAIREGLRGEKLVIPEYVHTRKEPEAKSLYRHVQRRFIVKNKRYQLWSET